MATNAQYPNLQPYERPTNYGGVHFDDYLTVYAVHRDSHVYDRSNWRVLLRAAGFTAKRKSDGEIKTNAPNFDECMPVADQPIIVTRAHHWAVGWIDTLRVLPTADSGVIETLNTMIGGLRDYPILNESDASELEWDEACEYWACCSISERVELLQDAKLSIFAARHAYIPDDPNGRLFERLTS